MKVVGFTWHYGTDLIGNEIKVIDKVFDNADKARQNVSDKEYGYGHGYISPSGEILIERTYLTNKYKGGTR